LRAGSAKGYARFLADLRRQRLADDGGIGKHYDRTFMLGLTSQEKSELVEYLKSL
jgi:uncharacterized protein YaaQ